MSATLARSRPPGTAAASHAAASPATQQPAGQLPPISQLPLPPETGYLGVDGSALVGPHDAGVENLDLEGKGGVWGDAVATLGTIGVVGPARQHSFLPHAH
jgi:hypothetical protein